MSKKQITASEILTKFKGASPAASAMYHRVMAQGRSTPSYFQERKPAVVATATPPRSVPQFSHPAPHHLASQFKGFTSAEQARDGLYSFKAGLGQRHKEPNMRAEIACKDLGIKPMMIGNTQAPTSGGYLVVDPVSAAIIERRASVGIARALCNIIPMSSGGESVPVESGGLTVYRAEELEAFTASDFAFASLNLTAAKRTVLTKTSNELGDDAVVSWLDRNIYRTAYYLASDEDNDFINADGTSQYSGEIGILASLGAGSKHACASGNDTWLEITAADICGVMAKPASEYLNGSESFVCSPQFAALVLVRLFGGSAIAYDATGQLRFLGKPLYLTARMPTSSAASQTCLLYGSFSEAVVLGDRGLSFASSDAGPGVFEAGLTLFRAVSRIDFNCHACGDASNAGAIAGLVTAAN